MNSLDTFIREFAAMLDGQKSPRAVEAVLGPSASGTARLGLYFTLVERQQRGVLDAFYSAVKVADGASRKPRFERWRDAFLAKHPPSHWAPARSAEHFSTFLERGGAGVALVELADFAWTRHLVLHAPLADDGSALAVRHYTHAVRAFTLEVERDGRTSGAPAARAETWLLGRSRSTNTLLALTPSVAALVVLQVLEDRAWSAELPQLPRADVIAEARALEQQGLLSSAAVAALSGWLP